MNTRDKIIQLGDNLIRERGYNAFSFSDISKELSIKNASIHYYFPTKSALVISIIRKHIIQLEKFKTNIIQEEPVEKITKFLTVYSFARRGGKISILGALSHDYNSFSEEVQSELKILTDDTITWLTETLNLGKTRGDFGFKEDTRVKAMLLITNILGAEQLSRITYNHDFEEIKDSIINNLRNF